MRAQLAALLRHAEDDGEPSSTVERWRRDALRHALATLEHVGRGGVVELPRARRLALTAPTNAAQRARLGCGEPRSALPSWPPLSSVVGAGAVAVAARARALAALA